MRRTDSKPMKRAGAVFGAAGLVVVGIDVRDWQPLILPPIQGQSLNSRPKTMVSLRD
jgi:hypothetical protein